MAIELNLRSFGNLGFWLCLTLVFIQNQAWSQWEDVSTTYVLEASCAGSSFGCGMSCADFNGDGLDDLTFGQGSGIVSMYARTDDGFELNMEIEGEHQVTGVLWVDVDGDGDLDLFVGRRDGGVKLYIRTGSGGLLDQSAERGIPDNEGWRPRGISACDFDNDQDLDIYIASYHITLQEFHYPNVLLINDGTGHFAVADDSIGVNNGVQTSFHGGWLDFDGDGWNDLWVINDRFSFPNSLYRNQGDGTFVDVAPELELDITLDPMTATVFDPDGDGDWDLFSTDVKNIAHQLFQNTDTGFVNVSASAGVEGFGDYGWGSCVIDIDGDSREDLMVATLHWPLEDNAEDNRIYMGGDSGLYFTEDSLGWPNEQFPLYHLGRFDLDGNRAPDVVGFGTIPIAQLLQNTNTSGASRMTVKLVGTTANSHAVGAVIQVYADGVQQMQQVDAGCDYVTQHSYTRFFGMGNAEVVDSIVVTWPAGATETWYGLSADDAHTLIQGTAGMEPEALERICPWDAQVWQLPFDPDSVNMTWNGEPLESDLVVVEDSGSDQLVAYWWGGAYTLEWHLSTVVSTSPDLVFSCDFPVCYPDPAQVSWADIGAESVLWMDSVTMPVDTAFAVEEEVVAVSWMFGESCIRDTLVELVWPDSLALILARYGPQCHDDLAAVEVTVGGGTPPLALDWFGADPMALGDGTWQVLLQDSAGCTSMDSVVVEVPEELVVIPTWSYQGNTDSVLVEMEITGGTPPYDVGWSGGWNGQGLLVAPVTLAWYVSDVQGCDTLDVLQIGVNSTGDVPVASMGCWRRDGMLGFTGPYRSGHVTVYDLMGRAILSSDWRSGGRISCPFSHAVIIRLEFGAGQQQTFLR